MIRALALSVAAFAAATPALAADTAAPKTTEGVAIAKVQLAYLSNELEARQHLLHQGYADISPLEQNASGLWTGVAYNKDGKLVVVAIKLPPAPPAID